MIIMKFGGSSIKDVAAIQRVAQIVENYKEQRPLIVLSALGGVTDLLIEAHNLTLSKNKQKAMELFAQLEERHRLVANTLISNSQISEHLNAYLDSEFKKLETFLNVTEAIRVESSEVFNSLIGIGELLSSHIFDAFLRQRGNQSVCVDVRPIMQVKLVQGEVNPQTEKIAELGENMQILDCRKMEISNHP